MTEFTLHTLDSAPEASKPLLAEAKNKYGMIAGLTAVMAETPGLLEAYQTVHELFVNSTASTTTNSPLSGRQSTWSTNATGACPPIPGSPRAWVSMTRFQKRCVITHAVADDGCRINV